MSDQKSELHFTVPGIPRPAPRARVDRGRGRPDASADEWMVAVRTAAFRALKVTPAGGPSRQRAGSPIWTPPGFEVPFPYGPVSLECRFFFAIGDGPALMDLNSLSHDQKPDLSNLVKAVEDALGDWRKRGALVWSDDCQVASYVDVEKLWGREDGAFVRIRPL